MTPPPPPTRHPAHQPGWPAVRPPRTPPCSLHARRVAVCMHAALQLARGRACPHPRTRPTPAPEDPPSSRTLCAHPSRTVPPHLSRNPRDTHRATFALPSDTHRATSATTATRVPRRSPFVPPVPTTVPATPYGRAPARRTRSVPGHTRRVQEPHTARRERQGVHERAHDTHRAPPVRPVSPQNLPSISCTESPSHMPRCWSCAGLRAPHTSTAVPEYRSTTPPRRDVIL